MITIVKDGLIGKVYFTCKNCECEFIADIEDCGENWDNYKVPWVIKCPQCHSECTSCRGVKAKVKS